MVIMNFKGFYFVGERTCILAQALLGHQHLEMCRWPKLRVQTRVTSVSWLLVSPNVSRARSESCPRCKFGDVGAIWRLFDRCIFRMC